MKPVELMHRLFGKRENKKCGDCQNLAKFCYGNKKVKKCLAYGGLHSSKADWAVKWTACGMIDKKCEHQIVSDGQKIIFSKKRIVKQEIDGQIKMEGT